MQWLSWVNFQKGQTGVTKIIWPRKQFLENVNGWGREGVIAQTKKICGTIQGELIQHCQSLFKNTFVHIDYIQNFLEFS